MKYRPKAKRHTEATPTFVKKHRNTALLMNNWYLSIVGQQSHGTGAEESIRHDKTTS